MFTFNPELIDVKYLFDVYTLISQTPEHEDLDIGFAKMEAKTGVTDDAKRKALGAFIAPGKRQMQLAKAFAKGWEDFNTLCQVYIAEDIQRAAEAVANANKED